MLREIAGMLRRAYYKLRPTYQYSEPQFDARRLPYQTVATGLSFQELNQKREEVGDLPAFFSRGEDSAELRKLGERYNAGDLTYEELILHPEYVKLLAQELVERVSKEASDKPVQQLRIAPLGAPTAGFDGEGSVPGVGILRPIEDKDPC